MNSKLVKVLNGIRRCGKSSILMILREELIAQGNAENHVLLVNFESMAFAEIDSAQKLYTYLKEKVTDQEPYYVLLDEIQNVTDWEKTVASCLVDFNMDIYITGSNSKLLSSELSTYLTGRFVEIQIYPLSFEEYLLFKKARNATIQTPLSQLLIEYIQLGGFPATHLADYSHEDAYAIINGIYSSILLYDVVQRYRIRNIDLLERVIRYTFDNIGKMFSARSISTYFKSQHRSLDIETVYNYLNALENAFAIYRVPRFDIRGKDILQTNEKYFLGDHGLLYALSGYSEHNIAGLLENIVFLELKRRGYRVYVGKQDEMEVDFVAEKREKRIYVQVCYRMSEQATFDREIKPLQAIDDNHPKYIAALDSSFSSNEAGIHIIPLADFLLLPDF